MKWLLVGFLVALLCQALVYADDDAVKSAPDFTGRYAELASPVPANVNVQDMVAGAPQQPEINDQYEKADKPETAANNTQPTIINNQTLNNEMPVINEPQNAIDDTEQVVKTETQSFTTKIVAMIKVPVQRFIAIPKVNIVLRNIGTCIVNGAMEIISHFFPTPLMPLIATAAGMVIPFEPVVMLREKMPVTSYRRAIKTAVSSFLNTFDKYKVDDVEDEDPYMTRRFNRRFMNNDETKKDVENKDN